LDHEVDVKSRYFRDPAGQLFALHTADRTPDSRANHCIRLELHRLGRRAGVVTETDPARPIARLDCLIEVVDPHTSACLIDLWLGSEPRSQATIDLMMLEWARSLLARIGRTTLLGIAILDLGATPRAEDGHRRYGHFTACPDDIDPASIWPARDEGYGTAARSTYTEVARPGSGSAAP